MPAFAIPMHKNTSTSTEPLADAQTPMGFQGMDTISDTRLQLTPSGAIDLNVVPLWTQLNKARQPGQTKSQKVNLLRNVTAW